LQVGLAEIRKKVENGVIDPGIRKKVLESITKANSAISHEVERGRLKVGKQRADQVSASNIVSRKRTRNSTDDQRLEDQQGDGIVNKRSKDPGKFSIKPGDAVSASAKIVDNKDEPGSFSKDHPARQFGIVKRIWRNLNRVQVEWDDGYMMHKLEELTLEKVKVNAAFFVTMMVVESLKLSRDSTDKVHWPRDFFHALVSSEWRDWVLAVKKEVASWQAFNAYSLIDFRNRKPGSSIVPLGELYTRKRDGAFKFRQYLMGNLLKKGRDFDETFSSCISWDSIRWFAAVACVTGKKIFGLDAVTRFL
jgi:hypothetical protein